MRRLILLVSAVILFCPPTGAETDWTAPLPPLEPWNGKSRELAIDPSEEWATPFEKSGLKSSPGYEETVAWLQELVSAAPELEMISIGQSAQGRDIWMVVASSDETFTPEELQRSGKPTILAQAGIHSGEIDGKDAGMMLLRDMTVRRTRGDLLARANLLFIPILSVDGHERSGPFSRINQRGPDEMGWRTNARNLNLNRDYAKLDTREIRAVVDTINRWKPDLYLDLHVTDGADYQYDITFGFNGPHAHSPAIAIWLREEFAPFVDRRLESMGHIPGPLTFAADELDFSKGIRDWTASARFSNGWGDARHLPTVLLENHSLKPFDQRVLGTYVFVEAAMRVAAEKYQELRRAMEADMERDPESIPLAWEAGDEPALIDFAGIESRFRISPITGKPYLEWTGRPVDMRIPLVKFDRPSAEVTKPAAWWIPVQWAEVIERLRAHGVEMETIDSSPELLVEMYRLEDPEFEEKPYEGHVRVSATPVPEMRKERFPAGSVRIPSDQPMAELVALLLEPQSPDSFL
ncbi:MAG: M14 family metallopeptidase, partial [Thermoanaerobaculia bacterium]|nr:M14 family metallopeptidase [Thermoanaerobaculia bacterium]